MKIDYVKKILSANVYQAAIETPISQAKFLSKRLGHSVLIKREDLQPVFSFKIRGAYNKMLSLSAKEKKAGVIAASAGNHAQGVALGAQKLNIHACIVMPVTTPAIKVESVKARGAEVVLFGDTFQEAFQKALEIQSQRGYTFLHPYDDPYVIAGQGTVAMEILRQTQDLDALFVPVGGGGLLAGISVYIKFLRPEIKVIGVESEDSACLKAALNAGKRVILPQVGIFADGVAVSQIGKETFSLIQQNVDQVITVSTDEICAAIKDIYDDTRAIAEPAGALALAGLKKYAQEEPGRNQTLLAVMSGANINFDRLRYISERTEIGEKREGIFAVEIPEKPGAFKAFCNALHNRNITEFNYRFSHPERAVVFVGIQLADPVGGRHQILEELTQAGYSVTDLSDDEVAKLHIRFMVGGIAPGIEDEKVFTFQFPERPQALLNFLNGLGDRWNISMFHYRNHGSAFGRVMTGLQVEEGSLEDLLSYLERVGYPFKNISDNEAYHLFLTP